MKNLNPDLLGLQLSLTHAVYMLSYWQTFKPNSFIPQTRINVHIANAELAIEDLKEMILRINSDEWYPISETLESVL